MHVKNLQTYKCVYKEEVVIGYPNYKKMNTLSHPLSLLCFYLSLSKYTYIYIPNTSYFT